MSTLQTLFSVFAFALLSTILLEFQGLVVDSSKDMSTNQDIIIGTALASSYSEIAQSMNFDEYTVSNPIPYEHPELLTPPKKGNGNPKPPPPPPKIVGPPPPPPPPPPPNIGLN